MGIIKEFRNLQKDVAVLRSRSGDDVASTGSGFQTQGTAGFLSSSTSGIVHLACTAYSSDSALQKAFFTGSVMLTASNSGAMEIAVKSGKNRLSIAGACIVTPSNAYQNSQYLSASMAWLPNAEGASCVAIARSPHHAVIVPLGGGGGGDFAKGEITYVTGVNVTQPDQYTLRINITQSTAKVALWQ